MCGKESGGSPRKPGALRRPCRGKGGWMDGWVSDPGRLALSLSPLKLLPRVYFKPGIPQLSARYLLHHGKNKTKQKNGWTDGRTDRRSHQLIPDQRVSYTGSPETSNSTTNNSIGCHVQLHRLWWPSATLSLSCE